MSFCMLWICFNSTNFHNAFVCHFDHDDSLCRKLAVCLFACCAFVSILPIFTTLSFVILIMVFRCLGNCDVLQFVLTSYENVLILK